MLKIVLSDAFIRPTKPNEEGGQLKQHHKKLPIKVTVLAGLSITVLLLGCSSKTQTTPSSNGVSSANNYQPGEMFLRGERLTIASLKSDSANKTRKDALSDGVKILTLIPDQSGHIHLQIPAISLRNSGENCASVGEMPLSNSQKISAFSCPLEDVFVHPTFSTLPKSSEYNPTTRQLTVTKSNSKVGKFTLIFRDAGADPVYSNSKADKGQKNVIDDYVDKIRSQTSSDLKSPGQKWIDDQMGREEGKNICEMLQGRTSGEEPRNAIHAQFKDAGAKSIESFEKSKNVTIGGKDIPIIPTSECNDYCRRFFPDDTISNTDRVKIFSDWVTSLNGLLSEEQLKIFLDFIFNVASDKGSVEPGTGELFGVAACMQSILSAGIKINNTAVQCGWNSGSTPVAFSASAALDNSSSAGREKNNQCFDCDPVSGTANIACESIDVLNKCITAIPSASKHPALAELKIALETVNQACAAAQTGARLIREKSCKNLCTNSLIAAQPYKKCNYNDDAETRRGKCQFNVSQLLECRNYSWTMFDQNNVCEQKLSTCIASCQPAVTPPSDFGSCDVEGANVGNTVCMAITGCPYLRSDNANHGCGGDAGCLPPTEKNKAIYRGLFSDPYCKCLNSGRTDCNLMKIPNPDWEH